jgi:hypothetical protein
MAGKKKTEVARRPVKARGSLPAPKVAPRRVRLPLYKRRPVQIAAGVVLLVLLLIGFLQFRKAGQRAEAKRNEKSAVRRFDSSIKLIENTVTTPGSEMSTIPEQFNGGQIDATAFKTKTDEWLKAFRDASKKLSERDAPPGLEETRALLYQGVVGYIDAVKVFQIAAAADGELRKKGIDEGRNLTDHAAKLFGLGKRELIKQKKRVGLQDPNERLFLDQPIPLPAEEVSPQPQVPEGGPPPGA